MPKFKSCQRDVYDDDVSTRYGYVTSSLSSYHNNSSSSNIEIVMRCFEKFKTINELYYYIFLADLSIDDIFTFYL